MLPYVILHNAVSLDGRLDWFSPDIGQFYGLIPRWKEDATLAGSDTILAATPDAIENETIEPPATNSQDTRPLLVIVDSRGRIRRWDYWRKQPYWRDVMALCSRTTPMTYFDYLREHYVNHITAGEDKIDLQTALEELNKRHGVKIIRVDSGGILNGALLRAGLVNEISLLIHPSPGGWHHSPFRLPRG